MGGIRGFDGGREEIGCVVSFTVWQSRLSLSSDFSKKPGMASLSLNFPICNMGIMNNIVSQGYLGLNDCEM